MPYTTAKMALRVWDQMSDPYDHSQLADNWAKVDYHDHSSGKGVQIPTDGLVDGAVTSAKLASTVDVSSAYTTWHNLFSLVSQPSAAALATATYTLADGLAPLTAAAAGTARGVYYLDPADYAASPRTTKLRIRFTLYQNAVTPVSNYTVGFCPVSSIGGTSGTAPTASLGAATQTAVVTGPTASTSNKADSSEFNFPASGYYAFNLLASATGAAGSWSTFRVTLQMRRV